MCSRKVWLCGTAVEAWGATCRLLWYGGWTEWRTEGEARNIEENWMNSGLTGHGDLMIVLAAISGQTDWPNLCPGLWC